MKPITNQVIPFLFFIFLLNSCCPKEHCEHPCVDYNLGKVTFISGDGASDYGYVQYNINKTRKFKRSNYSKFHAGDIVKIMKDDKKMVKLVEGKEDEHSLGYTHPHSGSHKSTHISTLSMTDPEADDLLTYDNSLYKIVTVPKSTSQGIDTLHVWAPIAHPVIYNLESITEGKYYIGFFKSDSGSVITEQGKKIIFEILTEEQHVH